MSRYLASLVLFALTITCGYARTSSEIIAHHWGDRVGTTLTNLVTQIGSRDVTLVIDGGAWNLDDVAVAFTDNIKIRVEEGSYFTGSNSVAGIRGTVRPQWFHETNSWEDAIEKAASSLSSGTVYFPAGDYELTALSTNWISVTANDISFVGDGMASHIFTINTNYHLNITSSSTNYIFRLLSCTNVVVSDLRITGFQRDEPGGAFKGPSYMSSGTCLLIDECDGVLAKNLFITDGWTGILTDGDYDNKCRNIRYEDITVRNNEHSVGFSYTEDSSMDGVFGYKHARDSRPGYIQRGVILLYGCQGINVSDINIKDADRSGVFINNLSNGTASAEIYDVNLSNLRLDGGNIGEAGLIIRSNGDDVYRVNIDNMSSLNYTQAHTIIWEDILDGGSGLATIRGLNFNNIQMAGEVEQAGFYFDGTNQALSRVQVNDIAINNARFAAMTDAILFQRLTSGAVHMNNLQCNQGNIFITAATNFNLSHSMVRNITLDTCIDSVIADCKIDSFTDSGGTNNIFWQSPGDLVASELAIDADQRLHGNRRYTYARSAEAGASLSTNLLARVAFSSTRQTALLECNMSSYQIPAESCSVIWEIGNEAVYTNVLVSSSNVLLDAGVFIDARVVNTGGLAEVWLELLDSQGGSYKAIPDRSTFYLDIKSGLGGVTATFPSYD